MSLFLLQGKWGPRTFLKMHFIVGIFLALLTFNSTLSFGQSFGEWQEAKTLYDSGKFDEAFKVMKEHPSETAQYYFDLGTIALKQNHVGNAVAYLEKANRLETHDPEIQQNLKIARAALGRTLGEDHLDPASNWLETVADHISPEEARGAVGLLGLLLALIWLRSYLKTRNLRQTFLHTTSLIGAFAFLLASCVFAAEKFSLAHPPAVAIERQVVRSGPGDQFLELSQLEVGEKIRVLGEASSSGNGAESWRQVRFSPNGIGWVRASSLLLL
jgi:tetratricopeptide (TPR) repeat protein